MPMPLIKKFAFRSPVILKPLDMEMSGFRGTDIPVKAWCSVWEALEWIAFRLCPIPAAQFDRTPRSARIREKMGHDVFGRKWDDAKAILFSYAEHEHVGLQGRRAFNKGLDIPDRISDPYNKTPYSSRDYLKIKYSKLGETNSITVKHITIAGCNGIEPDGILWSDGPDDYYFAFFGVQVNFRELVKKQPPPQGMTLLCEGERILVDDDAKAPLPSTQSTAALNYTTHLLEVLEAVRAKIAPDPSPVKWSNKIIEDSAKAEDSRLSINEQKAIATILHDDSKRETHRLNGQKGQQQRGRMKKNSPPP